MSSLDKIKACPTKDFRPQATLYSLEDERLLRDNPELAQIAEESGLNPKSTIQFIKQSLMQEAIRNSADSELKYNAHQQQHQQQLTPRSFSQKIADQHRESNRRSGEDVFGLTY